MYIFIWVIYILFGILIEVYEFFLKFVEINY